MFNCFYRKSTEIAGSDGVHAHSVAQVIKVSDFLDAVYLAEAAEGIDGFVFRAFDFKTGMSSLGDGRLPAAGHKTFQAGMGFNQTAFMQRLSTDFRPLFIGSPGPVAGRKCPGFIHDFDHHRGSHLFIGQSSGIVTVAASQFFRQGGNHFGIIKRPLLIALKQDAFEFLGSHDGAKAGAPG